MTFNHFATSAVNGKLSQFLHSLSMEIVWSNTLSLCLHFFNYLGGHSLGNICESIATINSFKQFQSLYIRIIMTDHSYQLRNEQDFKPRDFQYQPSIPPHHESRNGRAPPLGLPTEQERRPRSEMLSVAPPSSSVMEPRGRTKLSHTRVSEPCRPGVDQIPDCRYRSQSIEDDEGDEPELELRIAKRVLKSNQPIDFDEHPLAQQRKPLPLLPQNPFDDAIFNPIRPLQPDIPNSTRSNASKQSKSLSAQPKPIVIQQRAESKQKRQQRPQHETDHSWFPAIFLSILESPPPFFEPRAFSEEANHIPLPMLRACVVSLLDLVREATVKNSQIESRASKLSSIPETTRQTLCNQYCWRAYPGRHWILKWANRDWVPRHREAELAVGTRTVIEGMREAELRAEVVTGLEFWGNVLERSRFYESWVEVFEGREREEGETRGNGTKVGEERERGEGQVVNGGTTGNGKKGMSLEEAPKETAPRLSWRDM